MSGLSKTCQQRGLVRSCSALMLVLVICSVAAAQTTAPTAGIYESQTIRRNAAGNSPTTQQGGASASHDFLDLRRIGAALALVLGLIFLLRWVGRRYFPAMAGGKSGDLIRVLARSALTPKHHVLLVQVGRRVLVVADNGTQMSPLSEITDADEIAQLMGQVSRGSAGADAFVAEFGKAQEGFSQAAAHTDVEPHHDPTLTAAHGELAGLMQKVRGLAKQLGR